MLNRICLLFILTFIVLVSLGYFDTIFAVQEDSALLNVNAADVVVGMEVRNNNNWISINHDLYGTRSSNQTIIGKDNVGTLQLKWRLPNDFEIQDPPIIIDNKGYVQDYVGNVFAFDTKTGHMIWKMSTGGGPTMGLAYDSGMIFASTATNATIVSLNATDGRIIWRSEVLGDPKVGYSIDAAPIVWKGYVIAGSGGSGLPPGPGLVKGNITALNSTNGKIIWNLQTTTGEWVEPGKTPPNGGATAWSGGSLDPDTGIIYIPLGSASPNFNATTRQTPNLYSNHMIAVNITNGKIVWATPFIAHGTVLDVQVPDTHDWDTSWGSSITKVTLDNGTQKKIVIGHDKMGNLIAMDALTGEEIWWKTLGKQYQTDLPPRVSPLVTYDIVFAGYIPFAKKLKSGVILALDKETGTKLWEFDVNAEIAPVGPSIGDGMLFIPTGKIQGLPKKEAIQGSIVAFGLS